MKNISEYYMQNSKRIGKEKHLRRNDWFSDECRLVMERMRHIGTPYKSIELDKQWKNIGNDAEKRRECVGRRGCR
jgi:hypothetical protein